MDGDRGVRTTGTTTANPRQVGPVRSSEGAAQVELFLVTSVITIGVTRGYLELTGFPQIGGDSNLHVAHVLFGGVFMLAALVMFMLFVGRQATWVATFLAGIGFGLFIDEVGKFLTKDNDYFFRPAAAVMYLFLVLVYVVGVYLVRRRPLSDRELTVNSLRMLQEYAAHNLDEYEAQELRRMLEATAETEPLRRPLLSVVEQVTTGPLELRRLHVVFVWVRRRATGLARLGFLQRIGVFLFQVLLVLSVITPTQKAVDGSGFAWLWAGVAWAVLIVGVVAAVLCYRDRYLSGLRLFALALTVELLVVQFFELLDEPWLGVWKVTLTLFLLAVCHSMIYREEHAHVTPVNPS